MLDKLLKVIFLVGMLASEVIRAPHRKRNREDRRRKRIAASRLDPLEASLMTLSFFGVQVLPIVYLASRKLNFANYRLPDKAKAAAAAAGAAAYGGGLWLLHRAHQDLGKNWSPSLEIVEGHTLVTSGVYRYLRHPLYAAVWLFSLAQALLLHNWVAGLSGLATYFPIYLTRVPREERMMAERFGDDYRDYRRRTGGIIPRLRPDEQ